MPLTAFSFRVVKPKGSQMRIVVFPTTEAQREAKEHPLLKADGSPFETQAPENLKVAQFPLFFGFIKQAKTTT
jgi:hypothetical protein